MSLAVAAAGVCRHRGFGYGAASAIGMRFKAIALLLAVAMFGHAAQAAMPPEAARFPERPIRVIVPFAPGGGSDFMARLAGPKISESWGQPVIIDNRPGASATIGTDIVAKAPADGYTFGIITAEHTIVPSIYPKMPYHPLKDFAPIAQTVAQFYVLVVHPSVQAASVKDVIAAIKARGGRFNFGTAHWSVGHLAGEMFKLRAGVEMTHIPYKGTGPALIDLLGGQISLMFSTAPPALPHVRAGKLRAIAITAAKRSPLLPDLPTVAESGIPGFEALGWNGFIAPGRTPGPIVAKLNREIVRILALTEIRDQLARSGVEPVGNAPEQFASHIARELAQWARLVKDANLRLEH